MSNSNEADPPKESLPLGSNPQPEILPPALDTELRKAGVDTSDPNVFKAIEISLMLFRGPLPLPPAEVLREWEKIYPGITAKLIEWAELQASHRREREMRSERRKDRAQWISGTVAIGGVALAAYVASLGYIIAPILIAAIAVGGPVAAIAMTTGNWPSWPRAKGRKTKNRSSAN